MTEMERRAWTDGRVELRAAEDGRRKIMQRAVPYGELSVDLGGWREVIVAGAFAIDGDIRALWQHDSAMVLGRTTAGTLALRDDETGIYAESDPPDTSWARDALVSIERGDVTGSSFGFYVDEDEWILTEREVIRRVKRGTLVEVSPVTFPAYPTTSTSVRDRAAAMRAQSAAPIPVQPEQLARARQAARRRTLEILESASMSRNIRELMRRRSDLIAEARGLNDTAEGANRDLSEQEATRYSAIIAEIKGLDDRIERGQSLANLEDAAGRAGERQIVADGNIGMSRDDLRKYSLVRAINAAANQDWRGATLEREASEATAKRMNRAAQGFWVPQDVMDTEVRDMVVGTPTAGGYTVATDLLAQSFIELLRNRMMVRTAGATVLAGLVGDVAIPKQTGGATAYWVGENTAVTESQQTVGQVALSPKTVGAFTDISRKLLKQSSIDVEAFVRNDLTTVLALAIDSAGLHGPGTGNAPTGIAATNGIGSVAGGSDGAAPTWANIISLETEVAIDNADLGRLAYMSNAKVRGKLKSIPRTATYGDIMIWENNAGGTPVNGYPFHVTNQVSSTLTKGSSTGVGVCSAIFFGNWADLIIGMWGGLDILVDPYTGGTAGTVRVIALQDVDIAVRHAESFAAMLDALTT